MYEFQSATKNILTVSKLNRLARSVLEAEIGQVWLSAEISNFVAASSGHWYFTLKDNRAQVKAAMFKGQNRRVLKKPKEGDKVLVRANIGLYEPRGDYQLIVEHIEAEGEGQLKQQFEALKLKLAAEGIFAQAHKKAIPNSVLKVGIVTSPTGAALHDILTVLHRRNPAIQVVIYPTQVQGDSAVPLICNAIVQANIRQEVDVLIVGRGGGSLEDLWCFNNEQVAKAIFASNIPIISAVGHEIDISISDFSADLRAATPSAAAELVSQDQASLTKATFTLQERLMKAVVNMQQNRAHQFESLQQRLLRNHPNKQLQQKAQYVDQLLDSLQATITRRLIHTKQNQQNLANRLNLTSPSKLMINKRKKLEDLQNNLQKNYAQLLKFKKQALANNLHLLDTVSPLATLARGYSITFKEQNIVKSTQDIQVGQVLITRLKDGEVLSEIQQITG
jgi:exodeoxyribonuclease VII large subunit